MKKEVSSLEPDWTREYKLYFSWDPSRSLLASIRHYQAAKVSNTLMNRFFLRKLFVLRHRFWSAITGADIPINTVIGGGLLIPHPNGIVIHSDAKIGPNCLVFQQVTIGTKDGENAPIIMGHVDIGAGAKILGPITIGQHVRVGANSVVLNDVPNNKTVVGLPAKII